MKSMVAWAALGQNGGMYLEIPITITLPYLIMKEERKLQKWQSVGPQLPTHIPWFTSDGVSSQIKLKQRWGSGQLPHSIPSSWNPNYCIQISWKTAFAEDICRFCRQLKCLNSISTSFITVISLTLIRRPDHALVSHCCFLQYCSCEVAGRQDCSYGRMTSTWLR